MVSDKTKTTEERWRRYQRDLKVYRQRSLWRRMHPRFQRDLKIVPHVFLLRGKASMAALQQPEDTVLQALRGRAVWTLDTASRLVSGRGFLISPDLICYLFQSSLKERDPVGP